jgi:hypothetical protein
MVWIIYDELHAEEIGQFSTRDEALAELQRLAELTWDESPNQAPCTSWKTCGRHYELVEYDVSSTGNWKERHRVPALNVSQDETAWLL